MTEIMETQRKELVGALADLYANGSLIQASRYPDGRGGYTAQTLTKNVLLHRESTGEQTERRNVAPGNALIYVLNTDQQVSPHKGDGISYDGQDYRVIGVAQDPIGVAYECECERGHKAA
ncbi:MAG: hypothetical protein HKN36_09180 [Hellea sp.]|nr:hypothetical protein [Hellea sp.]